MKPRDKDQTLAETHNKAKKLRFKIEKLEERIAPKKGGIPGGCGRGNGPKWKC